MYLLYSYHGHVLYFNLIGNINYIINYKIDLQVEYKIKTLIWRLL